MKTTEKIVLILLTLAVALYINLILSSLPTNMGDINVYKIHSKSINDYGLHSAYSYIPDDYAKSYYGYPGRYNPYLPVIMYFYKFSGSIYQKYFSSSFDLSKNTLTTLIKLPSILFDLLIALIIFWIFLKKTNFVKAYVAMVLYAFNPAIILCTAYYGMQDSFHAAFLLLSMFFLIKRKITLSLIFLTMGSLAKPQIWVFVPLIFLLNILDSNIKEISRATVTSFIFLFLIISPFLFHGPEVRIDLFLLFPAILNCMQVVTANALNFWWLVTLGHSPMIPETNLFLNFIPYRLAAMFLFGFFYLVVAVKLLKEENENSKLMLFGFLTFAFFMLFVRHHENHYFATVPLLILSTLSNKKFGFILGILSVTFACNILLYDGDIILPFLALSPGRLHFLRFMCSLVNTLILSIWSVSILKSFSYTDLKELRRVFRNYNTLYISLVLLTASIVVLLMPLRNLINSFIIRCFERGMIGLSGIHTLEYYVQQGNSMVSKINILMVLSVILFSTMVAINVWHKLKNKGWK